MKYFGVNFQNFQSALSIFKFDYLNLVHTSSRVDVLMRYLGKVFSSRSGCRSPWGGGGPKTEMWIQGDISGTRHLAVARRYPPGPPSRRV